MNRIRSKNYGVQDYKVRNCHGRGLVNPVNRFSLKISFVLQVPYNGRLSIDVATARQLGKSRTVLANDWELINNCFGGYRNSRESMQLLSGKKVNENVNPIQFIVNKMCIKTNAWVNKLGKCWHFHDTGFSPLLYTYRIYSISKGITKGKASTQREWESKIKLAAI